MHASSILSHPAAAPAASFHCCFLPPLLPSPAAAAEEPNDPEAQRMLMEYLRKKAAEAQNEDKVRRETEGGWREGLGLEQQRGEEKGLRQ